MPLVCVLASRRSYGHCAAPSWASASSSEMTPSMSAAAPNAHSKSPMALLAMSVAEVGASNSVTGTLFGASTSSSLCVSQATIVAATMIAPAMNLALIIGGSSVVDAKREDERRELRVFRLVHEQV